VRCVSAAAADLGRSSAARRSLRRGGGVGSEPFLFRSSLGYLNAGNLFVKRIEYQEDKTYPDNGCNLEIFAKPDMLDLESLGPLVQLAPGAAIEHGETWDLVGDVGSQVHRFEIDTVIFPKVPPR
jgi:hypothetical protein